MDVRPERPEEHEVISCGLTDAVWEVAEHCWKKSPSDRPTADALCDTLFHLLEVTPSNAPTVSPPPTFTTSPTHARPLPPISDRQSSNEVSSGTLRSSFSSLPPLYSSSPYMTPRSAPVIPATVTAPGEPAPLSPRVTLANNDPSAADTIRSPGKIEVKKSSGNMFLADAHQQTNIFTKFTPPSVPRFETSSRTLEAPGSTDNWDVSFRAILGNQNPRELREALARANPDIILPWQGASPLSQIVILGLLHRVIHG